MVNKIVEYVDQFTYHGKFINRSKGSDKLCVLLAGYKQYLYSNVFTRLEQYKIDDMDICIITSGLYSEEINTMCQEKNWSYLYTEENNVSLVQNIAIKNHPSAKYIFKLDEDIFITNGFFDKMIKAYHHAQKSMFVPGVIAPLINVNAYGYVRILDKLGLNTTYEEKFGEIKMAAGGQYPIEKNPHVAEFMWGEGGYVPSIDEMNTRFQQDELKEYPCPIRFSIGAIMFERQLMEDMNYYRIEKDVNPMGQDEMTFIRYCGAHSRPIMVSENIVVGHLSFGQQNESMKVYYKSHPEKFQLTN